LVESSKRSKQKDQTVRKAGRFRESGATWGRYRSRMEDREEWGRWGEGRS